MQRQLCPKLLVHLAEIEDQISLFEPIIHLVYPEIDTEELLIDLINQRLLS